MGNQLPSSLQDGGVEPSRASLLHCSWSDDDDDCLEVRVDIDSGGGSVTEDVVKVTPEDKTLGIYGMLRDFYPPGIPICKVMLYFGMWKSEVEINDTHVALGSVVVGRGDEMVVVRCYWMSNSHVYVDILRHNESRIGVDPIFESVTADDLHFVCIQKEHVDSCVDLFWNKFIEMGLEVFTPHLNGTVISDKQKGEEDPESPPAMVAEHVVQVPLYGDNYQPPSSAPSKKDE